MLLDNDIVADLQGDGRYTIRRFREADGALLPIAGHKGSFADGEMRERLEQLRSSGDPYIRGGPNVLHYVQPPL